MEREKRRPPLPRPGGPGQCEAGPAHRPHHLGLARQGEPELLAPGVPVRPEHILILVRERASLMEAIVRELKESQVPVAGADRLRLLETHHRPGPDGAGPLRHPAGRRPDLAACSRARCWRAMTVSDSTMTMTSSRSPTGAARHPCGNGCSGAVARGSALAEGAWTRLQGWRADAARTGVFRFYADVLSRDDRPGRLSQGHRTRGR